MAKTKWCVCEGAKTCIGCLIESVVMEKYGEGGLKYLREAIGETTQ